MKKVNIFSIFSFNFGEDHSRKYLLLIFLTVTILVYGFSFTKIFAEEDLPYVEVSGDIVENTTWTKIGGPYLVTNDIDVLEGATLTIEPGVVVKFEPGYSWSRISIDVYGKIIANGTEALPIYFTSNNDDVGGSTDGDYYSCDYEDYVKDENGELAVDENGNFIGIGEEICMYYDWMEPGIKDWDGFYIDSSVGSSFKNVFLRYSNDAFYIYSADINFENLNISNSDSGFTVDEGSSIQIKDGDFDNIKDVFTVYDNSSFVVEGVTLTDVENGYIAYTSNSYKFNNPDPSLYTNANLTIIDSILECTGDGVTVFNDYNLKIKGGSISCIGDGITLFNDVAAEIDGVKIIGKIEEGETEPSNVGITVWSNTKPDSISVKNSEITGNQYGFDIDDSIFFAHKNSLHGNINGARVGFNISSDIQIDMASNYWGDKTGPTHSTNPTGLGDQVSDNILFTPFLKYDPTKENISNIMFIPGFQASRMYKMEGDYSSGTSFENKVWEPGLLGGAIDIYMNENGESIDKNIYTRDIISRATVFGMGVLDFYKSFFDKLDSMVIDGEMEDWKEIAYDWRFSPLDVVERGVEDLDGNISYIEELTDDQVPYIIAQLQKLVDTSNSEKVTIVTHSNGGLIAKALIAKLIDMKSNGENDLIDHIDNLIVVAPPLVGTPKATLGMLHGYDQGMFMNMLLTRKEARDFGQSVPGAYGLLPSRTYLSSIDNDLILLDESLDKVNNWRSSYGEAIDTYQELKNFLLDNLRINPSRNDLVNPSILNENILDKAELLHGVIDDLIIPSSIKVHQVAGVGLPTANDLRYKSKNECSIFTPPFCLKKKVVLAVDAGFTSDGDGTVVGSSALFGEGGKYYLNLETYNKDEGEGKFFYSGKDHMKIFEVPYLYDLIHNILKSDSSFPSYFTSTAPSSIDYTIIKMRSPVAIDIYNESGLHTGVVEGVDGGEDSIEEGIPNSLYMEIGEGKYIVVPKEGNYTLKLDGLSDGIFTLEQEQLIDNIPGDSVIWRDIPTTALFSGEVDIDGGVLATNISMDENGDGVFESDLAPIDRSMDEEKSDIIRGSSGSYIFKNRLISNILPENQEQIKLEIIKLERSNDSSEVASSVVSSTETKGEIAKIEKGTQLASVGSMYSQNPIRFKWQLVIVGSFFLLLGSLKFIFKLI